MKKILITSAGSYIGTSFENYINTNFPDKYTVDTVDMIGDAHGKKIRLVGWVTWLLKIMSCFIGLVNKALGNLTYEKSISCYKSIYEVKKPNESIEESKKCVYINYRKELK